jgi:CPA2 family monovalent cation:H+ antiporter-2
MHELAPLIKDLAVILGVASIITLLFQKIKQPVVLGYLLAGFIIGPYTPPYILINDLPNIHILSELGVIFLMFSLGLEFSFHKLKRVGSAAAITGSAEVILMVGIGYATGKLLGWSFYNSLFLGACLAISSTTIIIKALEELKLKRKKFVELVFGVLVIEDLLAILMLVALSTLVTTQNIWSAEMAFAGFKLILVVGSWFLLGYFLIPSLLQKIKYYASEESLTVVAIALCLALVCVAAHFHYSTALGAFIMGSILAETPLVHRIAQLVEPVRNIFAAVFFVSVGMLIDPKTILWQFPLILFICVVTILGKVLVTGAGALLTGQSVKSSLRIGFSMAQIGEFSFIIASLGITLHATDNTLYPIIVAVSAITTFTTPYLIRLSGFLGERLEQKLPPTIRCLLNGYTRWVYSLSSSSKQKSWYGKAAARLFINGMIVAIIFTATQHWLEPKFAKFDMEQWLIHSLSWFCACCFSAPFIWGMLIAFLDNRPLNFKAFFHAGHTPYLLGWLFTLLEICILSLTYFHSWLVGGILLLIVCLGFGLLYQQLDKFYQWLAKRLSANLQHNTLTYARYETLAPWDTQFAEFELPRYSLLIGKALSSLQLRQKFGINIVAIYRDNTATLSPNGAHTLLPFDKIIVLGSDEQLEQFSEQFLDNLEEPPHEDLLANFMLKSITLENNHPWIGKAIANSGIRKDIKGLAVGIERQGTRLLNPDSSTVLAHGDIVFIVGECQHLQNLGELLKH